MNNYKKNLYYNYIYEFFLNLKLTQLLWPTYLILKGFTLVDVGIAEGLFHLTSLLCELPTGMISDLYGRKISRFIGRILSIIEVILLLTATSRWHIYLAFIISALSYNMESGTDSAYVYDLMLENKDEKNFPKIQGKREVILQAGSFIGIFIGGFFADISYSLTYFISLVIILISIFFLLKMKEIKNKHYQKTNIIQGIIYQYRISYDLFKSNHQIIYIILAYSLFSASITTCHYYLTNYWKEMNITMSAISFFLSLENIAGIIAGLVAYKIIQYFPKKKIMLILPLFIIIGLMGIPFFPISIIAMIFIGFVESLLYVSVTTFLNEIISSDTRATLLSCMSMIDSIVMVLYFPTFGWIGSHFSLKNAFLTLAVISTLVYIVYQRIIRKKFV